MKDFALLVLRLTFGGLMAGHGAQKLFGWFGGGGMQGTEGMMQSIGMKPAKQWALLAGLSEFSGGVLTALGALNPLGVLPTIGAMAMATVKVHWGKPIWNTKGGAELPVLNSSAALALGMMRPGKLSIDGLLGLKLPRRLVLVPGLALVGASVAYGVIFSKQPKPQVEAQAQPQAREEKAQAVRVPETPKQTNEVRDLDKVLEEAGLEPLTDERLEAGESQHHPG